jgi:hypothetical protein
MKHQSIFPTGIAVGGGLTKREYFAVKAMQSMLASDDSKKGNPSPQNQKTLVDAAIAFADALLKALDGKN